MTMIAAIERVQGRIDELAKGYKGIATAVNLPSIGEFIIIAKDTETAEKAFRRLLRKKNAKYDETMSKEAVIFNSSVFEQSSDSFDMIPGNPNDYECRNCKADGKEHEVKDIPGPHTDSRSSWGEGLPTTLRLCSGCGHQDGPWVSSEIVGGGW